MTDSSETPGFELPLLLFGGFRTVIDEVHRRLAERGHPDARPAHGFALQAIGAGATASEVGRRLGISKQAAGKTIDRLEQVGYVRRGPDPADARRKAVLITEHGLDMLRQSAIAFDDCRAEWKRLLGSERLRALEEDLRTISHGEQFRLDAQSWLGG